MNGAWHKHRYNDRACGFAAVEADSRQMKLERNPIAWRAIVATICIAPFLFALILAASPQLHEQLHDTSTVSHECVVTLLSSGSCHHAVIAVPACEIPAPSAPASLLSTSARLIAASLEFSLLEHAPPARS